MIPIRKVHRRSAAFTNESLAAFVRRTKLCEEQGIGIDKVIAAAQLRSGYLPFYQAWNRPLFRTALLLAPGSVSALAEERRELHTRLAVRSVDQLLDRSVKRGPR